MPDKYHTIHGVRISGLAESMISGRLTIVGGKRIIVLGHKLLNLNI